jgi:hypothetical protein
MMRSPCHHFRTARRRNSRHPLLLLALLLGTTNNSHPGGSTLYVNAAADADEEADACPLWLAPSNVNVEPSSKSSSSTELPPKIGLYAGRTYVQNSTLPLSELAIPLVDFFGDFHRTNPLHNSILSFLEDQLWTPDFIGSHFEGNLSSPAVIPGIGVLANYHSGYSNVDFLQASVLLRQGLGQHEREVPLPAAGEAHPMRGAVTPYYNATLVATETIPAGMEIFANFGGEL